MLLGGTLALGLLIPAAGATEEPASAPRLSWETGAGKSYVIPALEVGGSAGRASTSGNGAPSPHLSPLGRGEGVRGIEWGG